MDKTFAEKLKQAKKDAGLTQQAMADRMNIPKRTIEEWERGNSKPPEYIQPLILNELKRIAIWREPKGELIHGKLRKKVAEQEQNEPLIDRDTWERAQKVLQSEKEKTGETEQEDGSGWEFIEEPNTVDTLGRKVYHARCKQCGFIWTDLYAVRTYFKHCPNCGIDTRKKGRRDGW